MKITIITFTLLSAIRFANAQCSCSIPATCPGTLINENYLSTSPGWSPAPPSMMLIGDMYYNHVTGPSSVRMFKSFPALSPASNNFYAQFQVGPEYGFSPGHVICSFSQNSGDFNTNNDQIGVIIDSPIGSGTNQSTWTFKLYTKDNANPIQISTAAIPFPGFGSYWIRLIRRGYNLQLSIFNNPTYTTHIPGSPICYCISGSIAGLSWLQHGKWGTFPTRDVVMRVTKMRVCNYDGEFALPCRIMGESHMESMDYEQSSITIFPSPTDGIFSIELSNSEETIHQINITDLTGRLVKQIFITESANIVSIDMYDDPDGIYFVEVIGETQSWVSKSIISK